MDSSHFASKPTLLKNAGIAACAWLLATAAFAQATVQLTASPTSTTLPDGQNVPMWGLFCNNAGSGGATCTTAKGPSTATPAAWVANTAYVVGAVAVDASGTVAQVTTAGTSGATTPTFGSAPGAVTNDGTVVWSTFGTVPQFQAGFAATWAPPVIRVPANTPLTINLVNKLTFTGADIPTSLVIVGQLGGGLGTDRSTTPSPVHAPQGTTWPGTLGGIDPATAAISVSGGGAGYALPPAVSINGGGGSGATAVAAIANGMVTGVTVTNVGSGYTSTPTVAIDPPPCTINGSTCIRATATMNVTILQSSDGSATFVPPPQADRVRSFATEVKVADGATGRSLTWSNLRPGTYLIHSGTQPSIQHPMGLYGVLVVADPAATPLVPSAYGTPFDTDVPVLLSEIDPDQNRAVDQAVKTSGFSDELVWDGQTGKCGDPAVHTCYPPAVNYSPLYYLVNGVSFDRTKISDPNFASAINVPAAGAQKNVLLRFVNAGLRLHVPSVIGANMTLLAEDSFKLPGTPRMQASVALAAGKTYDVVIQPKQTNAGTYDPATYAVFDRQLSLSTANQRDGGMQAYIKVAGGATSGTGSSASGTVLSASDKTYYCAAGTTLSITDPAKGLLAGTSGANGLTLGALTGDITAATLTLNSNGTFTYTPSATATAAVPPVCGGTFQFVVNGAATKIATVAQCDANSSSASGCSLAAGPLASNIQFVSNVATRFSSPPPGVIAGVSNPGGLALKASGAAVNADGSFAIAGPGAAAACNLWDPTKGPLPAAATCVKVPFTVTNTQGKTSSATATVAFLPASGLTVNVKDAKNGLAITDYRWIIEEDRTFWIDPKCQINTSGPRIDSNGRACAPLPVESLGYSFHTANMPVVAAGCVGDISCELGQTINNGTPTACDIGNGQCVTDGSKSRKAELLPGAVYLDPNKRYFISVLPGDGVNPTIGGAGGPQPEPRPNQPDRMRQFDIAKDCGAFNASDPRWQPGNLGDANGVTALCGHAMGGAQIAVAPGPTGNLPRPPVNIALQQTPLPTAKIAVFVFQDDSPLNGENDAGGGVDVVAPLEPGLGGFEIKVFDQAGGLGDATGQITYDQFNQPVSNSLAGFIDPITGQDACPITKRGDGLVGMIPTCPLFEADGVTQSPLAGQAVIANLYPGLYEIVATPAADRIGRGEEWLQTNTLDGGKAHEAFIKANEPGYFQEFGPGGFHVAIGFANPKIINARRTAEFCTGMGGCNATLNVQVTSARMSRTPDQRIYSSGNYDAYGFTQCYVSIGPPDGADFALEKCDANGVAHFTGLPTGDFKLTVFDQWNDLMLDGLVSPVKIDGSTNVKEFPVTQWRANLYTRTFVDVGCGSPAGAGDGVSQACEPGLALVNTNIRYRDGSIGFFNNTDLNGYAGFNEVFPFMNWLVVETTSTRYKQTGTHVVYDAGGPSDGSTLPDNTPCSGSTVSPCGDSTIAAGLANTIERVSLPANQRVPGAVYCATADCTGASVGSGAGNTAGSCTTDANGISTCTGLSTGRIDPPMPWGPTQGWQGLLGQNSFIEFGMKPFAAGENGGISGHVIYASTRPFDDPTLLLQLSWEPGVPRVKINLYQKTVDANGSEHLTLIDHTTTTSWDDWAQGFRSNGVPNMNCPGQDPTSPFFQTLKDSKQWLDPLKTSLTNHSLFKCYDGWSQMNQIQPAPYDGMYKFPSVTGVNPANGKPAGTNCLASVCVDNPTGDGTKMLPAGKYVVEVIVPPGFELVKEEDKNILLGDVYIAPITQQLAGFGNIFIMPDQAAVNAAYNRASPGGLNKTTDLGAKPRHEGDTGSIESFWPCVGAERIVPDLNSLYPGAGQAAPFAGAKRRLCDRKEVTLDDQASVLAKFYIFSSTHIAGHFTGTITNDFASEFDPFSPQFGEKFGPPNLPVAMRDFTGNEVARVYADQWGIYNGLYFSSYGVNPPNPTGYVPQMAIACMNDPGPIPGPNGTMITDPSYSPAYSNYCYETPFMPGFTAYMDTPVIPTQAFADGYNLPDSEYPDATPAIGSVVGNSGVAGPWVSAAGQTLTIRCLGADNTADPCSKVVQNPNYSGPNAATEPYNQKTIIRHYGFGGTQGTGGVTIAGVTATVNSWSNTQIIVTVPTISTTQSSCGAGANQTPFQRTSPSTLGTSARCGQLEITAANGKRSIDAITVTVAGKPPTVVSPSTTVVPGPFGRIAPSPIQTAIDSASPGDLIIVAPGTYRENLIMWKPVRLQGVGADSVTINADAHPAGKMDSWRRQVACLFGLTIDGVPNPNDGAFDPSGTYSCPASMHLRADRIPFEAFVGWDAAGNGNLAQILQEPTLMGAYEGAGITTTGRGVRIPPTSTDFWGQGTPGVPGAFPDGSVYLRATPADCTGSLTATNGRDYGTANFQCNPSRVDGVSIINSSQGGGGIFMHGWNHLLEIANTRIYGNHGTLSGAINLGNGEAPPIFVNDGTICGGAATPLCPPFGNGANASLIGSLPVAANATIPFQINVKSHLHHNMIINNASIGDALFSGTPSGGGGITISAGADNYTIDHNWIAGNLSSGDGAGMAHQGVSFNGTIRNNWILFNQSTNPTLPTNGGGLLIAGSASDRTLPNGLECGSVVDVDCPPGIGDGVGQGNVIDANLIMGNSAESGSGGGLRLQHINGSEVATFPVNNTQWYGVTVTNNVIANNVAGWDGGGVSMQDAFRVIFVNNTVASNDSTASAGALFKTLGAINSSSPPPGCIPTPDPLFPQNTLCLIPNAPHSQQPAGLVTTANTPNLVQSLPAIVNCPVGYGYTQLLNGDCRLVSKPAMANNMFWQNRAFRVDIVGPGSGNQSQQNIITMTPQLNQTATGQCPVGATYWDIGVRTDDVIAGTIPAGTLLTMANSILSNSSGVTGNNNFTPGSSPVIAQFCNGARVPPENCSNQLDQATCKGYNAPPGRSETTGLSPVFVFNNITPAATVDEGHNWLNLVYGPLTLNRSAVQASTNPPELMVATGTAAVNGGAYSIVGTSAAVNRGTNTCTSGSSAPNGVVCALQGGVLLPATTGNDFFGNSRPKSAANPADVGAVEYQVSGTLVVVNPAPLVFNAVVGTTTTLDLTVSNNGTTSFVFNQGTGTVTGTGLSRVNSGASDCNTTSNAAPQRTLAAGALCTIRVQWVAPAAPTGSTPVTGSVAIVGNATVTNAPVTITANAVAATRTASLSPNPLAFGTWANGTTSATQNVTVTNTGNAALPGTGNLSYPLTGSATFTRVTSGTFPAGAPNCGNTLAVGASCTVKLQFAPTSALTGAQTGTLTVAGTGVTVTPVSVSLTGTGVANRAAVSIAPLTITLPNGTVTDDSAIILTNAAPAGGANLTVTNVAITSGGLGTGGNLGQGLFNLVLGQDACTNRTLPPGGTCSVGVRFTRLANPSATVTGTISFTSNGTPSPATGNLIGIK